jgi:hypothetical protein
MINSKDSPSKHNNTAFKTTQSIAKYVKQNRT